MAVPLRGGVKSHYGKENFKNKAKNSDGKVPIAIKLEAGGSWGLNGTAIKNMA